MWRTSSTKRQKEHQILSPDRLWLLTNGFCRNLTTNSVPINTVRSLYMFGKQLWLISDDQKYFELFDCVYYSMCLPEKIVRTYLHQIITEIERSPHLAVIEPSDILLDNSFNLFILNRPNKTNVSTYIPPELLTDEITEKYLQKCAMFSIGVIIFILLCGCMPFEIALPDDKWYKMIIKGQWKKYWKTFKAFSITKQSKDMLQLMLCPWNKRMDVHQIKECDFYNGDVYESSQDIIVRLKYQYNLKEELRRKQLEQSDSKIFKIPEFPMINLINSSKLFDINATECPMFPQHEIEGMFDVYCSDMEYDKIYYGLAQVIRELYHGSARFDAYKQCMQCAVKTRRDMVKFLIKVYESRKWKIAHKEKDVSLLDDEYKPLYIVRIQRTEGDCYEFLKIKNLKLLMSSDIMSGLSKYERRGFRNLYSIMVKKKERSLSPESIFVAEIPRDHQKDSLIYHWY